MINGDISYRVEHLDFRPYRQGRKQLGRFFENSRSTTSSTGEAQVCTTELDAPTPEGRAKEEVLQRMHKCMHACVQ